MRRQAVVGGMPEPGSSAFVALVPVSPLCDAPPGPPAIVCSGTLVAPRVVLTAAHCVEGPDAPQVLEAVFAAVPADARPAERIRALGGRLHPEWVAGEHDLGVLFLSEDAPVLPLSLPTLALTEAVVGQSVRVVGFGADERGETGRRLSGISRVTALAAGSFSSEAAPGMSCGGDSGGPVLLEVAGTEHLVGVTSSGDPACTTGVNMRVDAHTDWLQAVLEEAARAQPPRPRFDPAVDRCAESCRDHADCPLGMACVGDAEGGRRCAVAGLEAGNFGEVCTGSTIDVPCVRAGDACREWLPCPQEPAQGCAAAGGREPGGGIPGALVTLLVLVFSRPPRSACSATRAG